MPIMLRSFILYSLKHAWEPQDYRRLLDLSQRFCSSFILVRRQNVNPQNDDVIRSLAPFLIEASPTRIWPGTCLIGKDSVQMYKYYLADESIEILRHAAVSLWDWIGPQKPEDLSFLRPSGIPWFISISHEHDAFFKLCDGERVFVETVFGKDSLVCGGEDQRPQEAF